MYYQDKEIPKHKKKAIKTIKKTNHKHDYKNCLLYDCTSKQYMNGNYCTICNKIGSYNFFDTIPTSNGSSRLLTQEELLIKYTNYEIKEVGDIFKDKFIK